MVVELESISVLRNEVEDRTRVLCVADMSFIFAWMDISKNSSQALKRRAIPSGKERRMEGVKDSQAGNVKESRGCEKYTATTSC